MGKYQVKGVGGELVVGVAAGSRREVDVENYEGGVVNRDRDCLRFQMGISDKVGGQGSEGDGLVDGEGQATSVGGSVLFEEVVTGDVDSGGFWAQFGLLQGCDFDFVVG